MLSPLDDLPIHQVAAPMRQVGTSDRNFYDRYYFNCHPCSDELFLIIGQGQYPNLGVTDAFALVRTGDEHRVVRASRDSGSTGWTRRSGRSGSRSSKASRRCAARSTLPSTACPTT